MEGIKALGSVLPAAKGRSAPLSLVAAWLVDSRGRYRGWPVRSWEKAGERRLDGGVEWPRLLQLQGGYSRQDCSVGPTSACTTSSSTKSQGSRAALGESLPRL